MSERELAARYGEQHSQYVREHDCRSRAEPTEVLEEIGWLQVRCRFHCPTCGLDFEAVLNGWSAGAVRRITESSGPQVAHPETS